MGRSVLLDRLVDGRLETLQVDGQVRLGDRGYLAWGELEVMRLGTRFREVDDCDVIASDLLCDEREGIERPTTSTFPLEAALDLSVPQPVSEATASVRAEAVMAPTLHSVMTIIFILADCPVKPSYPASAAIWAVAPRCRGRDEPGKAGESTPR